MDHFKSLYWIHYEIGRQSLNHWTTSEALLQLLEHGMCLICIHQYCQVIFSWQLRLLPCDHDHQIGWGAACTLLSKAQKVSSPNANKVALPIRVPHPALASPSRE